MSCRQTYQPHRSSGWAPVQMIAQEIQTKMNQPNLRVGDRERDDAARALGEHFAAGRLDRAEYDERLDKAFAARTAGELGTLFRDLPQQRPPRRPERETLHRHGFRFPFLPLLLLLVGSAMLFHAGWIVWVGLGVMLLAKRFQGERRAASRRRTASSWD